MDTNNLSGKIITRNIQARFGWSSNFPYFRDTAPIAVPKRLEDFIRDASASQKNAWRQSIPRLQDEDNR